jgi:CRP-like cAMP-binding protein
MNLDFNLEDIEIFLDISEEIENESPNQSLKKLLSVQDKIDIFKDIDSMELKALVYDVEFKKYKFKDYIIKDGEYSENIFFIIKGECHIFKNYKNIAKLSPGETFGEIGAIFKQERTADVVAANNDTVLLKFKIDEENLEFNARALAILYKNLAFAISNKLQELNIAYINIKK